jgi:hypothetical protein
MMRHGRKIIMSLAMIFATASATAANDFQTQLNTILEKEITLWLKEPIIIDAIKFQNLKSISLDQSTIDELDKQWRNEERVGNGPLIDEVNNRPLSKYLLGKVKDSNGLFVEIFVMDAKGLNVGESQTTSDYFQGDEAKWQKTFPLGANAVLIEDVDYDESARAYVAQISRTISDPADGRPIGAITVDVNVEKLP